MSAVWFSALRSVPESLTNGTPSPSPTVTTSPPPSSPPPGGTDACTAAYRTIGTWSGGFQAEVTVRNNAAATLNGWTVRMTLGNGQSITNLWNGANTGTSGAISVRNAPYNGTIATNAATTFGFVANGNGAVAPTGLTCASP